MFEPLPQQALRESEALFRTVFDAVPAGLAVSSFEDGRFHDVNQEFERIYGWSKAEVIGKTSTELGMWVDAAERAGVLRLAASGGGSSRHVELRLRGKDGRVRVMRCAAHQLDILGRKMLVTAFVDVTEARHAEQRYRELVDGVRDVVFALTPEGLITSLNPAFERITGLSCAEWLGRHFDELVHPDDAARARTEMMQAATLGPADTPPLRIKRADGGYCLGEVNVAPRFEDGKLVSLFGIGRDISERASLEEQLRQSQKMEAVGVLAGGVAHDFNNILGIIQGYSAILMRDLQGEESRCALLAEIQGATERAVSLTRQLMLFTRQQVADPRLFDLVELLSGTTKMLSRVLGDDVQVVLRPLTPRALLLADAGQLEQVLANLAANARDAMPKGGTLTLEVDRAELSGAAASEAGVVPGNYVVLSVIDTGVGLDVATKARVFEPFFTTKPSGKATGLGLATVFGIVRQNGGHIAVQSELGRGATFRIWLPLAAESSVPPPPSNQLLTGTETLLVVDDEPRLRALACTVLRGAGYTVLDAQSGGDALLVLEQHPEVALLLTDVVMPLMSGDQLVERASQLRPGLPAVFMSGYTGIGAPQGRDLGSAQLVQKPFKPESLLRAVRTALEPVSAD